MQHAALQLELIKMQIDDQAARGNMMDGLLAKYALNKEDISIEEGVIVDAKNRNRLKEFLKYMDFRP